MDEAEVSLGHHLLGGWVVVGSHKHQGALVKWSDELQQVVDIWGDRSHGALATSEHPSLTNPCSSNEETKAGSGPGIHAKPGHQVSLETK